MIPCHVKQHGFFTVITLFLHFIYETIGCAKKMASESSKRENLDSILQEIKAGPHYLSLQYLREITDDFSEERELGRGGFAIVYKGVLDTGEVVAVKRTACAAALQDGQFQNEVYRLMVAKHPNIVRCVGYCCETQQMCVPHEGTLCFAEKTERLVCLEYLPNKSLQNHISDETCGLDWHERYKIIKGICRGLHYLHEESAQNTSIIHADLKPANILLTNEMEPKITDFGQSRLLDEQQSPINTKSLVGTLGYMAREYLDHGTITKKTDIFSLGVIIIEIITGHREYPQSTGESMQDFVEMVLAKWKKRLDDLGCTSLEEDCQQIKTCIEIGLRCVQMNAAERPTAEEIIKILSDSTNLQVINEERSLALIDADSSKHNVPVENSRSNSSTVNEPPPHVFPSRICAGCQNPLGHGRFLGCMDSYWHPQCFRCFACNKPISECEFSISDDQPYHKSCYKEFFHPKCDVCNNFIPMNRDGLIEYRVHPFWKQKYCPSHEDDVTPRCCSCERMEPTEIKYITLDDGRKLCLECLNSSVRDTPDECQHLYMDVQDFFEGLNMKVEQQIPLLLVERHTLNEALEAEKIGQHLLPETRGLCLSVNKIVRTILKVPKIELKNRILDMLMEPYKLSGRCEVIAILILHGLPRLLTGYILAHEMMHAYLCLKGFRNLSIQVEEGICQVLSYLWLESEIIAGSSSNVASSSEASPSSPSSAPTSSKKGAKTEFEKKLREFAKYQIETDCTEAYGDGFRAGYRAVESYGLKRTLDHIKLTGSFPY